MSQSILMKMPRAPLGGEQKAILPTVVGVNDLKLGSQCGNLVTYGLGSCISIVAYSSAHSLVAMSHYMLPHSSINPEQAAEQPLMFGDTSTRSLLGRLLAQGIAPSSCRYMLIGGAAAMLAKDYFNTGARNLDTARVCLKKAGIFPQFEEVGGNISRTVSVDVATGIVSVKSPGLSNKVVQL